MLARDRQRTVGPMLLEAWLNDVLMARAPDDQPLDMLHAAPLTKQGLQSFGIDREALQGAGVSNGIIDRLYRGLYVYSAGFSDLLRVRTCSTSACAAGSWTLAEQAHARVRASHASTCQLNAES